MKTIIQNPTRAFLAIVVCLSGLPMANAQNGVGINTDTPKSDFEVNGSLGLAVTTLTTSDATLDATTKSMVVCNNGSTAITVTLPDATVCLGRIYTIKKGSDSTANVTLAGASQTIDGFATYLLRVDDQSVTVFSDGTADWKIVGTSNEPFPMGEINYFSTDGAGGLIDITAISDGSTNMVACAPANTSLTHGNVDFIQKENGQLQYLGDRTKHFHIACTISTKGSKSGDTYVYGIAKVTPGTPDTVTMLDASKVLQEAKADATSTALHVAIAMQKNDYLQLYAGNLTAADDATILTLTLFALGMD